MNETWVIQMNCRECPHRYKPDVSEDYLLCELYNIECLKENCKLKPKESE
jgi:hypothetical protein